MALSHVTRVFMKIRTWVNVLLLVAALYGCSASTNALLQSAQYAFQRDSTVSRVQLNPNFRYLRVTVGNRTVLLVLGYEESHLQGAIQVWYSAQREVLRIQNGRVIGAVGLTTEWHNVVLPELPRWSELARIAGDKRWVRTRDVLPGYHFGVRDALALHVSPPPFKSALQNLDPKTLTWFEERIEPNEMGGPGAKEHVLPPARYAVAFRDSADTVVYGEQCLASDLCFTWQRWPAVAQQRKETQ